MRDFGPAFLHFYGVDEAEVLDTWTVERFRRYQSYVLSQLNQQSGGVTDGR